MSLPQALLELCEQHPGLASLQDARAEIIKGRRCLGLLGSWHNLQALPGCGLWQEGGGEGGNPSPAAPTPAWGALGLGGLSRAGLGAASSPPCHQSRDTPGRIQCPQSPVLLQGTPEMQETKEHFQCSRVSIPSRLLSTAAVLTSLPAPGTSGEPQASCQLIPQLLPLPRVPSMQGRLRGCSCLCASFG